MRLSVDADAFSSDDLVGMLWQAAKPRKKIEINKVSTLMVSSARVPPCGRLYIVATPIGNLDDISGRAVKILGSADVIACEDTRRSRTLLDHLNIFQPSLLSLHSYNEQKQSEVLVRLIEQGTDVAVISDAGTPLISDPGFTLVQSVWKLGIKPIPIPGASSLTTILSVSPIPLNDCQFVGFLPSKTELCRNRLKLLLRSISSVVFFESAQRFSGTIAILKELGGGDRSLFVGRELTKQYESLYWGKPDEVLDELQRNNELRGEFVCVLQGSAAYTRTELELDATLEVLLQELSPAQASRLAAKLTGSTKREVYLRAIELTSI